MRRWPIIRHIRWLRAWIRVEQWYAEWARLGYLPVHRAEDDAVLLRIWSGKE
jgi:hypothetical protein